MPLNCPEFNTSSSGTPPLSGRAAGVFAPGCAFGLGRLFAPNKKWAVGPLISPPAGVLTATRADKFVCMVIIRRNAGKFKTDAAAVPEQGRSISKSETNSYSPDYEEAVWQNKSSGLKLSQTAKPRPFGCPRVFVVCRNSR